jgi:hypothetical protein
MLISNDKKRFEVTNKKNHFSQRLIETGLKKSIFINIFLVFWRMGGGINIIVTLAVIVRDNV